MSKPRDKILCGKKIYRYVIACMHNCPEPHYCPEFWRFFQAKGITPVEFYNEGGIGEEAMRRIVFDCDRCGKKDIPDMFGMYSRGGETEEDLIDEIQQAEMVKGVGHGHEHVSHITFSILGDLEQLRQWQHYCRVCFKKVADSAKSILNPPRKPGRKKAKPAPKVEEPAKPAVAAPAAASKAATTAKPVKPAKPAKPSKPAKAGKPAKASKTARVASPVKGKATAKAKKAPTGGSLPLKK